MLRRAGDVLGGKYRLERPLARGGMGAVWVGRHLELDLELAIKVRMEKVLNADLQGDWRFKREAQLTAQLRSPHIVHIYDFAVDAGEPYIVMELLQGEDLRCRLERVGALPMLEVASLLKQAAIGLTRAHDNGVVHRDLKPSNLFLARTDAGEVLKILDFGIAKHQEPAEGDDTAAGVVLGSPAHMSPEQTRGEALDYRSDLWALAVVAFHAVTGMQPFKGTTYVDTVRRIAAARLPRPSKLVKGLPPGIDDFFARALAQDPERRFQTAFELARGFAQLLGQRLEPFSVAPTSMPGQSAGVADGSSSDSWRTSATQSLCLKGAGRANRAATKQEQQAPARGRRREASGKRRNARARAGEAAASAERPRHNLPALLSRFVGRERELTELQRRLGSERLVTLAGPGGAGKTRLALELGVATLGTFHDGMWFVDLAPLVAAELVVPAVAQALGVREEPGKPLEEALVRALETLDLLIILDNCEHLLTASAHLAETLLRRCPELRILSTSREPLAISGECVWRLAPLAVPDEFDVTLESLNSCESVILFVERAAAARADFRMTSQNAALVAGLCRRLDGIPLALELAASRLRSLSLEQLVQRLEKRFDLLSGGNRTALPRHQTLRAAIDWSYEFLGDAARAVFRRLGVFRDGFTLEAAEAVCAGGEISSEDVLELLTELVDKSLVTVDAGNGEPRYRLLETLREYALARLRESEEEAATQEQSTRYFLVVAEPALISVTGVAREQFNVRLHLEYANLRAVLETHALTSQHARRAVRMAIALGPYWLARWQLAESNFWTEQLLAHAASECSLAERAWLSYWRIANCHAAFDEQYDVLRALLVEVLEQFRRANEQRGIAYTLNNLGLAAMNQDRAQDAVGYYEESLQVGLALDDLGQRAIVLCNLGEAVCTLGDMARGETLFEQALALHRPLGPSCYLSDVLYNLGDQALRRNAADAAEELLTEALEVALHVGSDYYAAKTLFGLGRLLVRRGAADSALTTFAAAEKIIETIGGRLETYANTPYREARDNARAGFSAATLEQIEARGRSMALAEAAAYGLAAAFRAA